MQRNLLLLAIAIVLAGVPTLMALGVVPNIVADPQWAGGDGIISETAAELAPDYQPWFTPFFSPAELGIEPIMFGLQGLLGSLLASGFLGWLVGRRNARDGVEGTERRTAMIVSAVAILAGVGLLFVQTDLGELQAFIAALQGLALGTLAFFVGYPMGRRAASARSGVAA
jgi:cobalt/nickel transport protein